VLLISIRWPEILTAGKALRDSKNGLIPNVKRGRMKEARYLVVGGSSGMWLGIAMQLRRGGGKLTVVSKSRGELPEASGVLHILLDAVAGEIPADTLPVGLEGRVYCPGTTNLHPLRQLKKRILLKISARDGIIPVTPPRGAAGPGIFER
jgi:hypothetical protein